MKILNSVLIACAWWVAQVSAVVVGILTFITNIFKKVVYKTVPLWYYYPINYGGTENEKDC